MCDTDKYRKKYVMIVTQEDQRYDAGEKDLSYFSEHPEEGLLADICYGNSAEELVTGQNEGLFYQLYDLTSGARIGTGIVSMDMVEDDLTEFTRS